MRVVSFLVALLISEMLSFSASAADPAFPLPQAHAHNDYAHARPLLDALDHGFCSVEADIFLVNGQLLVAHTKAELDPKRQLQTLYLDPLRDRIKAGNGQIYPKGAPLTLFIDIKTGARDTYVRLHDVLRDYSDILTSVTNGIVRPGPVTVVISGNRDFQLLQNQETRYAGLDGRVSDLDSDMPAHLMPIISDRWSSLFRWRGQGPMSNAEREVLRAIVAKAHGKHRRVRFWATPENEAVWRELLAADVDLINSDDLPGLQRFLTTQR